MCAPLNSALTLVDLQHRLAFINKQKSRFQAERFHTAACRGNTHLNSLEQRSSVVKPSKILLASYYYGRQFTSKKDTSSSRQWQAHEQHETINQTTTARQPSADSS